MTYDEAKNLKTFKHYCTCGGYAGLSDRAKSRHPHMSYCAQADEWEEWKTAMESGEKNDTLYKHQ